MPIDIEKYSKHLAPFNLSKDREEEVIHNIYAIMNEFVSAAFNKHPVQQAIQTRKQKSLRRISGAVDSGNDKIKESFHNVTERQGK